MSSEIINTTVEEYKKLVESLHSENYEMMVDLTVVDWFRKKEPRFEVVVQFLSISKNQRKTIKVFVDDEELSIKLTESSIPDILADVKFFMQLLPYSHPRLLLSSQQRVVRRVQLPVRSWLECMPRRTDSAQLLVPLRRELQSTPSCQSVR